MKITYLLPDLGSSGGSQVLYQFMDRLSGRDHEVALVTPCGRIQWRPGMAERVNGRRDCGEFENISGEVLNREELGMMDDMARRSLGINPGRLAFSSLVMGSITEGLIRHWLPSDVTIATHNFTAGAAFHLMDRTAVFYHVQAYEELFTADQHLQKLARMTYFLPLRLVGNSTWMQNRLKELTGRPCGLLTPGIDTEVFRPQPGDAGKFDQHGEFRVISCYSAGPFKGWKDAAQAMRLAAQRTRRPLKWVVFGGRPDPVDGVEMELKGKVYGAELAGLYSSCHACLMPSWLESFPLPPLEAMACGTPVVATPAGTEDYIRGGHNALAVPARNPEAIAGALLRLEEDPALCYALAEEGFKTSARYGWDNAVKRMELLLAEAVTDPAKNRFTSLINELAAGRAV